jgi:hypothetical protein
VLTVTDAESGDYVSFSHRHLAFLASSEEPALNNVLRVAGVPVLAQGTTEAERHVQWVLGLESATGRVVSERLLRLYSLVQDGQQAASQDEDKYWGYLRVLSHLLETQVIATTEPVLAMLRLRCQDGQFKHVNQVKLPSILGHPLPDEVGQQRLVATPPEDCAAWSNVSPLGFELFLSRLGCSPPPLASLRTEQDGQQDEAATRGVVTIDVSELCSRPQDLQYLLHFGTEHRRLLQSGAICVRSRIGGSTGALPPYECFVPHVVEDDELPVVLLDPSIPAELCRPGQRLHEIMRVLGVRELPSARYFIRAIRSVVEAQSEAELGGMPTFHRLRRTRAVEGSGAATSDADLGLLQLHLVQKLLDDLRKVASEPGVDRLLSEADLQLPCEVEEGVVLLPPRQLFLLDSYDEGGLSEAQREAYPLVVSLLNGVRATWRNNVGYLNHRPLLLRMGGHSTFHAKHVSSAISRLRTLQEEQKQQQRNSASIPGPAQDLKAMEVTLYRCLDDMLGSMGDEERRPQLAKTKLPTEQGGYDKAEWCVVPSTDCFKHRLLKNKGAPKEPLVSPALVGLTHLLSASQRPEDLIENVLIEFKFRPGDAFLLGDRLTEVVKERLAFHQRACPSLQVATFRSFAVKGADILSIIMSEYLMLKGYVAAANEINELVVSRPELEEGQPPPCLLVLRLNVAKHQDGDDSLSTSFTQRLHASLAMLIQTQHGGTREEAMATAAQVVKEVHARLPEAVESTEGMTAIIVSNLYEVKAPYASVFLPPLDEKRGMDGCLSLRWREPIETTGGAGRGGGGKGGRGDRDRPKDRPVDAEMTREQYLYILEQGERAERYAHDLFTKQFSEYYNPENCWLSENKKSLGFNGKIDETASE